MDDEDDDAGPPRLAKLTIDAPRSRLQTLVCDCCFMGGVELVQAPELVEVEYNGGLLFLRDYHPISFGCVPSLQRLRLHHYQHEDSFVKLKLSELLVNCKLESLGLAFHNGKVRYMCTQIEARINFKLVVKLTKF